MVINIIQDVATPHNNVLMKYIAQRSDVRVNAWYANEEMPNRYPWSVNITHTMKSTRIYGTSLNIRFLWYCLKNWDEKFFIVGWMNSNTIALHFLFFILRRSYNHWSDLPKPIESLGWRARVKRRLALFILRHSIARVFCVGKLVVEYFQSHDFISERLVNLPVFIETGIDLKEPSSAVNELLSERSSQTADAFIVCSGSRLLYEKGFDLLVDACAELPKAVQSKMQVYIVGSGPERQNLEFNVNKMALGNVIKFVDWLDIDDFQNLIARSDVFVIPSRFDAYGSSIYAMALGVPVIGSTGAGAVLDRLVDEKNGLVFPTGDASALARALLRLHENTDFRLALGVEGRLTALDWRPELGARIVATSAI